MTEVVNPTKGNGSVRDKSRSRVLITYGMKKKMVRMLAGNYVKAVFVERSRSQFASIDRQIRKAEDRVFRAIKHG